MWPKPQFPEEILNGKLHFLCSACHVKSVGSPLISDLKSLLFAVKIKKSSKNRE